MGTGPRQWDLLLAIAAGGIAGAEARYGVGEFVPHAGAGFPWSTLVVNVSGSLMIGALTVLLLELTFPHRLARPFLGVGVLGGYTTFSTFSVDAERLVRAHEPGLALGYAAASIVLCLLAVTGSTIATQVVGRAVLAAGIRHRLPGRLR